MVGGIAKRAVRESITKRVRNIWVKINLKWSETVVGWPRTLVNLGNARHSGTLSNTVETNSTSLATNYFKLFEKCAPIFQMKLIFQVFLFHIIRHYLLTGKNKPYYPIVSFTNYS